MDSLGKLLDALVLVTVMFIFPVSWALLVSDQVSLDAVSAIAESFMDEAEAKGYIDYKICEITDYRLGNLTESFSTEITVERNISERKTEIGKAEIGVYKSKVAMRDIYSDIRDFGLFSLCSGDILTIKISDEKTVYYIGTRKII